MPSKKHLCGNWAEEYVVQYLVRLGWEILARQFRTRRGEIDVIARDPEGTWVFVEVKARTSHRFGLPEEAVTSRKMQHIIRALHVYVQGLHCANVRYRIDVIALDIFPRQPIFLRHFPAVG